MPQENPFVKKRNASLHSEESSEEKAKTQGIAFYREDMERLNKLKDRLKKKSRRKINNSVIVRVALEYLEKAEEKGANKTEQELTNLLTKQS